MSRGQYERNVQEHVGRPPQASPDTISITAQRVPDHDDLLTLREAAAVLGIDCEVMKSMIQRVWVPIRANRQGNGHLRFRRREIAALTGRS